MSELHLQCRKSRTGSDKTEYRRLRELKSERCTEGVKRVENNEGELSLLEEVELELQSAARKRTQHHIDSVHAEGNEEKSEELRDARNKHNNHISM